MKIRNVILGLSFVLLSSCVVKSLHPFYTKETISFDENFIGEWEDSKKGKWKIVPFAKEILKGTSIEKLSKEDLIIYEEYKNGYYIKRTKNEKDVIYLANPFKINNQTFLDFLPLGQESGIDGLLQDHLVYAHTLIKYDILPNGEISIKWFDEDKIQTLFKEKRIKIKHEVMGVVDKKYLLTASSKELQSFLKKYIASNDNEKWKTSTKFTLTKLNG
mgnify:CR=1 FL=1